MYCDWPHLDRCCFCLPLRRGVLVFAYANILFCAFNIGFNAYIISRYSTEDRNYRYVMSFPPELVITMTCVEIIFTAVLIYGAHMKNVKLIRAYYYFSIIWIGAMTLTQLIEPLSTGYTGLIIEALIMAFAYIFVQLYLLTMLRSLLKNLETAGPHVYDNQLHQIVNGDLAVDSNGIYNNTTTPSTVY